jgi:hypothetical protein
VWIVGGYGWWVDYRLCVLSTIVCMYHSMVVGRNDACVHGGVLTGWYVGYMEGSKGYFVVDYNLVGGGLYRLDVLFWLLLLLLNS